MSPPGSPGEEAKGGRKRKNGGHARPTGTDGLNQYDHEQAGS